MLQNVEDLKTHLRDIFEKDLKDSNIKDKMDVVSEERNKYDLSQEEAKYVMPTKISNKEQSHNKTNELDEEIGKRLLKLKAQ